MPGPIVDLLREAENDQGVLNPAKALKLMNFKQKEQCPEAYEPEFVTQHRKKVELQEWEKTIRDKRDAALFDFDDSLDELSKVSDRYPVVPLTN